jgi:hypothetical protein
LFQRPLFGERAALFDIECGQKRQRGVGGLPWQDSGRLCPAICQQHAVNTLPFLDDGTRRIKRPTGLEWQVRQKDTKPESLLPGERFCQNLWCDLGLGKR